MKRNLMIFLMAAMLLTTRLAFAQPQLQLQALTAIAGPGYQIRAQENMVAVHCQAGMMFFTFDSISGTLDFRSILQISGDCYDNFRFHPTLPLFYFLASHWMYLVDLRDISNPILHRLPNIIDDGDVNDFDLDDDLLYVLKNYDTIDVYDNHNPFNPRYRDVSWYFNHASSFIIDDNYLHGSNHGPEWPKYGLFNIQDLSTPVFLGGDITHFGHIESAGGWRSVLDTDDGLYIYTILQSPPYLSPPAIYTTYNGPAFCNWDGTVYAENWQGICKRQVSGNWSWTGISASVNFVVEGSNLFNCQQNGAIAVWDVTHIPATWLDSYEYITGNVEHLTTSDNQVIISGDNSNNILIYDISELPAPELLSNTVLIDSTCDFCKKGDALYVLIGADSWGIDSLAVLDISEPIQPQLVDSQYINLPPNTNAFQITCSDSFLYIVGNHNLITYNLLDPLHPQQVSNNYSSSWYTDVVLFDEILALGVYNGSQIKLFNATANPSYISTINLSGTPSFITGKNDTLIAGGHYNFQVFSIANPTNPTLLISSSNFSPGEIYNASFDGWYLYASISGYPVYYRGGLAVFSIIPGTPTITMLDMHYTSENYGGEITYNDSLIFFAQRGSLGIYSFTNSSQNSVDVIGNHPLIADEISFSPSPNPFNPTTNLTFTLPHPAKVSLQVFDINGRVVGVQHVEPLPAGQHTIPFDGSGLPSGIYFARLTAGEYSSVQKLVLLK